LAAELQAAFGVDAELAPGANGVFDVTVDGNAVFSKHGQGRFPNEGEVVAIIRENKAAK
jgi:selT/selW/selH-like putative selenoprotein